MTQIENESRALWKDLLILYPIAFIATLPYGSFIASEDGLPGDIARIAANAAAAGLGFWLFACIPTWARRKHRNRLAYGLTAIALFAGFATLAAYRRT